MLHLTRLLLGFTLLFSLLSCGFSTPPIVSQPGTNTTIIMVRHAERDPGFDPPLNAEGQTRAAVLAEVLGQNGVSAIYASDYLRNRQTAEPLAKKLGLSVGLIAISELANTKALAANLGREFLSKHAGGVVLLVGNVGSAAIQSNGILEDMYQLFGGTGNPPNRYQDMTIIVVPEEGKGSPRIIRTTYGSVSTLD